MSDFNTTIRSRIREDYLTCTICLNEFTTPKALPCLHTFCLDCLRDYVVGRNFEPTGMFPCPVCRAEVPIPQQGLTGFPDNHMIASLLDDIETGNAVLPVPAPRTIFSRPIPAPLSPRSKSPILGVVADDPQQVSDDRRPDGPPPPKCVSPVPRRGGTGIPHTEGHGAAPPHQNPAHVKVHPLNIGALITEGIGGVTAAVGSAFSDISGHLYAPKSTPQSVQSTPESPYELVPKCEGDGIHYHRHGGLYPQLSTNFMGPCIKDQLLCCGKFGPGVDFFLKPFGLAVGRNGEFVITDRGGNRIFVFSNDAEFKHRFNTDCVVNGVAITKDNDILLAVSKCGSSIMRLYTMDGKLLQAVGDYYKFDQSSGIAITPSDYVAVSNLAKDNVLLFTNQRKFSVKFGWKGSGDKHFMQPRHVTATSKDYIIVSDTGNNCLKLYDLLGNFKRSMGSHGSRHGQLDMPLGIACDSDDNIIIADANNFRVQVFTVKGGYYTTLVEDTNLIGPDVKPINVAVTPRNNVAVLLYGTGFAEVRVYNWRPNNMPGI